MNTDAQKNSKKAEVEKPFRDPDMLRAMIEYMQDQLEAMSHKEEQHVDSNREQELFDVITNHIHILGIPAHIKGYRYLRQAIIFAIENPESIDAITKELYPEVAKTFNTTSSRVERAIRHAIEMAWERGEIETLREYFGNTVSLSKGKPTNSEFIALMADKIGRQIR